MKKETKRYPRSKKLESKIHEEEKMYYVFGFETNYIEMDSQVKNNFFSEIFSKIKKFFIEKVMPFVNFFRYL